MDDFEEVAIKEVVHVHLGPLVEIAHLPMSDLISQAVLWEIKEGIGRIPTVYWVENAPPVAFSLSGFRDLPIIISATLAPVVRKIASILTDDRLEGLREGLLESSLLKVVAQIALTQGGSDFAVRSFIHS